MKTIWKFPIRMTIGADVYEVEMPIGAKILHVGRDPAEGIPCIWAEIGLMAPKCTRNFMIKGTGWNFEEVGLEYIGTAICGEFVWHIYERKW